jgi:hypothetical protein
MARNTAARPAARQCRDRESGGSFGPRKLWLGIRSDCGSVGQPGARSLRPDGGQHPALAWHRARTAEKPNDHLEGFHLPAYGRPCWHGLLHGRGADLARSGDVLCSLFHSPGQPAGIHRGDHRSSGCELDESGCAQCDVGGGWDICTAVATFCRIAMPSSPLNSGRPWRQGV